MSPLSAILERILPNLEAFIAINGPLNERQTLKLTSALVRISYNVVPNMEIEDRLELVKTAFTIIANHEGNIENSPQFYQLAGKRSLLHNLIEQSVIDFELNPWLIKEKNK